MSEAAKILLSDVNFSAVFFSDSGRVVTIEFLDMADGSPCAQLTASGVVAFNYHNTFEDDAQGLAAYVGEVTCRELQDQDKDEVLTRLGYSFPQWSGRVVSARFHLGIKSGELAVDFICGGYELSRRTP